MTSSRNIDTLQSSLRHLGHPRVTVACQSDSLSSPLDFNPWVSKMASDGEINLSHQYLRFHHLQVYYYQYYPKFTTTFLKFKYVAAS
jgi:hypothetical protein